MVRKVALNERAAICSICLWLSSTISSSINSNSGGSRDCSRVVVVIMVLDVVVMVRVVIIIVEGVVVVIAVGLLSRYTSYVFCYC